MTEASDLKHDVPDVGNDITNFDMLLRDAAPKLDKMWWHYPHLRKLNFFLLGAILVQATNGYDGSMLNGLQSLTQWSSYFNNPSGATLGTLSSGTTIGLIVSLPLAIYSCEKFGRRWPIIAGSVLTIVGAVIQSAAVSYWMFWIGRFIIGFGLGLLQSAAPMLLSETAYPAQRSQVTSLYETSFPLGKFHTLLCQIRHHHFNVLFMNLLYVIQVLLLVLGLPTVRTLFSQPGHGDYQVFCNVPLLSFKSVWSTSAQNLPDGW
jgi:MFS family permease